MNPLQGSVALDFVDGWVVDGFSLGSLSGGDGDGQETTPGHVQQGRFRWTTHFVKQPHFLLYVI